MPTPALVSRPSALASSTTPSGGAQPVGGQRRGQAGADPHAGHRADEDVADQVQVDVARGQVGERGDPEQRWRRGRRRCRPRACGLRRKIRIRPTAIRAPLPAEVTPSTKPIVSPSATAATLWRRSSGSMVSRSRSTTLGMNSARQNTATPVSSSATATAMITPLSNESPYAACRRSSRSAPPSAPGIEPTRQPQRERNVDRALAEVPPAADRLGHRAVGQVGADGDHRLDPEHEDQQRRHERAAAHAGGADEDADAEAEEDQERVHVLSRAWMPHSILSVPAQRPARPPPGWVQCVHPIEA